MLHSCPNVTTNSQVLVSLVVITIKDQSFLYELTTLCQCLVVQEDMNHYMQRPVSSNTVQSLITFEYRMQLILIFAGGSNALFL